MLSRPIKRNGCRWEWASWPTRRPGAGGNVQPEAPTGLEGQGEFTKQPLFLWESVIPWKLQIQCPFLFRRVAGFCFSVVLFVLVWRLEYTRYWEKPLRSAERRFWSQQKLASDPDGIPYSQCRPVRVIYFFCAGIHNQVTLIVLSS